MYFLARMRFALSQANTKAEIITPIKTAKAKLCKKIVINVTTSITKISCFGILVKALKLAHSKVPMATIIITPVKAAIGNNSITGAPTRIITKIVKAAMIPDNRALEPEDKLTKVWAIIGQPPIPKKKPLAIFAVPCAKHSLLLFPFVPVISSTKFKVNKPSVKPTAAIINP